MKKTAVVTVTTAQKLTPKQRSVIKSLITQKIGSSFTIDEVVDSSVVGGIRLRLGEQEFDATISGTLERVESLLEMVEVTTAQPLTTSQRKTIAKTLEKKLQRPFDLIEVVDPNMIGGLRLRVGSREYDGTIRKRLEQLRINLTSQL